MLAHEQLLACTKIVLPGFDKFQCQHPLSRPQWAVLLRLGGARVAPETPVPSYLELLTGTHIAAPEARFLPGRSGNMAAQGEAQFVIKNGSGSKPDVHISAQLGGTVAELKAIIQREYPGNPAPSEQTVNVHPHVFARRTHALRLSACAQACCACAYPLA